METAKLEEIVVELAAKPRHEKVRANIYILLTDGLGARRTDIDFEKRVPEARGRIDALLGRTIFEFKSDLLREQADAEEELSRYLPERESATQRRYVGIATDGLDYRAYEIRENALTLLKTYRATADDPRALLAWIDGAASISDDLPPDALTLRAELGKDSIAFRRSEAELAKLWSAVNDRADVQLKRQIWRQLLSIVYGKAIDDDALWFQHTFLVVVAKAIAARAIDFPLPDPHDLLSGKAFENADILGAVESDFFDWVLADGKGEDLVRKIAAHVARFRLHDAKIDVLKILYESLIDPAQRHDLGEYYTPDWLATKICRAAITEPLSQTVLDPACGSGTFLFHAIRRRLAAADAAKTTASERAADCCRAIAGMDIHPVAVIIARVTYLLALGDALRHPERGEISLPVYLGDALQWNVRREKEYVSMLGATELIIKVPPRTGAQGKIGNGEQALQFPESVCQRPELFDRIVERMQEGAAHDQSPSAFAGAIGQMDGLDEKSVAELRATYERYIILCKEGRNSIWGYVARNLSRPLYLSSPQRRVDVVIGNPPWLSYRYMSAELQTQFKEAAKGENIYIGGKLATHADLSGLFFARAQDLYLKEGGEIAFVLPLAALTRGQFALFRSGAFHSHYVQFTQGWTFDDSVGPLFPVPSCVLFARKGKGLAKGAPAEVTAYRGRLPHRDADEREADLAFTAQISSAAPATASFEKGSPYRNAFRQGATLVPRMLCIVERQTPGRLGMSALTPMVVSRRTNLEKKPWKDLPALEGRMEAAFLRPVYLGESIAPFRPLEPRLGVIPYANGELLDAEMADNRGFTHLTRWMRSAEQLWSRHGSAGLSFSQQLDYYGKLSTQFPIKRLRVVYAASGTVPAATVLREPASIIEHKLYWMRAENISEAHYLVSILNSECARMRIAALQSKGQWGARDFDKVMFTLPIPRFDKSETLHQELAAAGAEAARIAAAVKLPETAKFQRARKLIRDALADAGVSPRIDDLVERLLSAP